MTSLLKSLSRGKFRFCSFLNAASENDVSTLMPYTVAFALFSFAMLSRNVHSSFVHTPVNAAGKNARTTGCPFWELRVTSSRLSFINLKSGAFDPTVAAIKPPQVAFSVGIVVKKGFTRDRGSAPHQTLRSGDGCRRRQLHGRA